MPSRVDQRDALSLAGAVTGIQVDLLDGVSSLDAKTLPPGGEEYDTHKGWIKAWRAHLDTLRMSVFVLDSVIARHRLGVCLGFSRETVGRLGNLSR